MYQNSSPSGSMQYYKKPIYSGFSKVEYLGVFFCCCILSVLIFYFQIFDIINQYRQRKAMNAETLIELPKCNISYFKQRQKGLISTGPCSLINSGSSITFKSPRAIIEIPKKSIIARLQQVGYVTYLNLHKQGGVNTISVPSGDILNQSLHHILQEHLEVVEYFSLPPDLQFKKSVVEDCPIGQPGAPELGATNEDKLNQIGSGIGNVFGGISCILDMDKINKASNDTVSNISKNIFGERVLSKWQAFKNKCSKINDAMTDAIKPVSTKCKQIVTDIGKNLEQSDNTFIKNVRDYSKKTQVALNQGYEKGDAPRRASYLPQSQQKNQQGQGSTQRPVSFNVASNQSNNSSNIMGEQKLNERKSLL